MRPHRLGPVADGAEPAELRDMAHLFLGLVAACPDAIVITELAGGRVVAANGAASALFGIPPDEMVGMPRSTLVDNDDPRLVDATIAREQSGRYRGAFRIVRADGQLVEAAVTTVSFVGPDGLPLIGSILREAGDPVPRPNGEDVFLSAFDIILELGPGGVVTNANETAAQRLGLPRDDAIV